jgi:hypothetical protein
MPQKINRYKIDVSELDLHLVEFLAKESRGFSKFTIVE